MEVIAALDERASQLRRDQKLQVSQRLAELATALDDAPGSLRRELRDILARGQLPIERALRVLSAAMRPVPVPMVLPLGKERSRLRQLAEKIDPASEPVLGLLTLTQALREADEEALAERLLRAALTARPREVMLYHTLGQFLTEQKPPRWTAAVEFYRAARGLRSDLGVNLADALLISGRAEEGLALNARMVRESPDNPYLYFHQGSALSHQGRPVESEAAYRKAIALKPDYVDAYNALGAVLNDGQGKHGEAEGTFRKAIALKPDYAIAYSNLGVTLTAQGKVVEAEAACRKAIDLNPDQAHTFYTLGGVLRDTGKPVEAEAAYRQAIALDPDFAQAYNNLGVSLKNFQGKPAEAEAMFRNAIALNPDLAPAHVNLGGSLVDRGKVKEAEAACRRAIALEPDNTGAYAILGGALKRQGKNAEAEAACRKSIALNPNDAYAYNILGDALNSQEKVEAAEAAYRKVIALKLPDNQIMYFVHLKLGNILKRQERFKESLLAFRSGPDPFRRIQGVTFIRVEVGVAERLVEIERKFPGVFQGKELPVNPEDAVLVAQQMHDQYKKRYAASARLYAHAFAAEPKLTTPEFDTGFDRQLRYSAACSAASAAAGQGEDARSLPDKTVAMFRRWTLGWLRDDLMAYAKLAEPNNPAENKMIQQKLAHWRVDPDLASVRDPQAFERLPENERAAWQALWRDVDELAKRVAKSNDPKP